MNHRDIWFVGLLALAYLYFDASAPGVRRERIRAPQRLPLLTKAHPPEPRRLSVPTTCPRNLTHKISLRGDGAKWCLTCDEAFYPSGLLVGDGVALAGG